MTDEEYDPLWPFRRTANVMRSFGINANLVPAYDMDITGYYMFVAGENGDRLRVKNGELVRVRHQWPSPEAAIAVIEQYILDKQAGERASTSKRVTGL